VIVVVFGLVHEWIKACRAKCKRFVSVLCTDYVRLYALT
jgi:hypothetical protein